MAGTLIIGYGNPMRGDDAIGCHAARELEQHFWNDPTVEVMATQQLTPEMVDDILQRDFVLFLDASFGGAARNHYAGHGFAGARTRRV